jgi:ABC-2 type transport system ATP-binding protein
MAESPAATRPTTPDTLPDTRRALDEPPAASRTASSPNGPPRQADGATPEAAPPAVLIDGVSRRFDDVVAVDGLSLVIQPGVILGLIGPSGSGKTTTVRMLTGALRPDKGSVIVLGQDPTRFDRRVRERIGYLPQLSVLFPELTAWENVDFVASLFGMLLPRRMGAVRRILRTLGLWDERDRQVGGFSGGMKRRVALACALVGDRQLYFLDEPTTGIDPILRETIWAELGRLRDAGATYLVTTQYVSEAEECDYVALLARGRLIALGTPDELRARADERRPDNDGRKTFDDVFADLVRLDEAEREVAGNGRRERKGTRS